MWRYTTAPFQNPRGGGGATPVIPERNPEAHAARLLENLDALETQLQQGDEERSRVPEAEGHLVAAQAAEGTTLAASSLGDARAAIAVVAEAGDRALIHLRHDDIEPLRRKIRDYGDPAKETPTGNPRNQPLVAPLEGFRPATLGDLSDGLLTEANVEHGRQYWVELWVRGGRLEDDEIRARVRREVEWLAEHVGAARDEVRPFSAMGARRLPPAAAR
jgi:hypothetical protein